MSEVLGFGANSYRNYEAGEVPNQSNARLILLADDAHDFQKLVLRSNAYEGKTLDRILLKIESIIREQEKAKQQKQLENYLLGLNVLGSITGYRQPDLAKFSEMAVFFTEKMQPYKTKMNKLLFYADFAMFSKIAYSISGVQYRALQMGPVPDKFQSLFDYLNNNNDVDIQYVEFDNSAFGEQFLPNANRKFNPNLFDELELKTLEEVAVRFKATSTTEIIEISHREKAWLENEKRKKIIDYRYGFDLN
jgi:uncharacterized phage-associated protein